MQEKIIDVWELFPQRLLRKDVLKEPAGHSAVPWMQQDVNEVSPATCTATHARAHRRAKRR